MITLKIAYWDRISYTNTNSEIKTFEVLTAENENNLFEEFYKKNNQLKYCNGAFYKFIDYKDQQKYSEWNKNLSHAKSFDLYYGKGIVD